MNLKKMLFVPMMVFLLVSSAAGVSAGDFDWTRDFELRATSDLSGFRARLATRFKVGDAEIDAVLRSVGSSADAYMLFRLGEMSSHPTDFVIERYRTDKKQGWGGLAKSLGIKPGSREFHALKQGDDFYDEGNDKEKEKGRDKPKSKSKSKSKGKK